MPRRAPALFTSVLLLLLTSCGTVPGGPGSDAPGAASSPTSFTSAGAFGDADMLAAGDNDDFDSLLIGGPYYAGRQPFPGPAPERFAELRGAKVEEAIRLTQEVRTASTAVLTAVTSLQDAEIAYLNGALELDETTRDALRPAADAFVAARVRETALAATIDALVPSGKNAAADAALQYRRTVLAIELSAAVQQDLARTIAIGTQLSAAGAASADGGTRALATALDASCAKVDIAAPLGDLQAKAAALGDALAALEAADALFARAAIDAAKQQLPDLRAKTAGLQPRDGLDAETITLVRDQLAAMEAVLTQLDQTLPIPAAAATTSGLFPVARAEEGYMDRAYRALAKGANAAASAANAVKDITWEGLKQSAQATRTAIGVGVDLTKATVDTATDTVLGTINGKSAVDLAKKAGENFAQVKKNYDQGTSGSQVYKDAGEMLEGVENAGKELAEKGVENTLGKGTTSWLAGQVAKTTVGMFTGFGKGVYKIANPTSTKGEIAEGAIEVGLSFVGGSKVLVKGSQVLKGTAPTLKTLALKSLNVIEKEAAASEIALLKSINAKILKSAKPSPADIERLIMNSQAIEAKQAAIATFNAAGAAADAELARLAKEGGSAVWANITAGGKKSFNDFVRESFDASLKGLFGSGKKVLGESFEEFFDNLIAEKGDDLIEAVVKDLVDKGVLPGMGLFDGSYAGSIATGEVTIPLRLTVQSDEISGGIDWSMSAEGSTATVKFSCTGPIDKDGVIHGKCPGKVTLSGGGEGLTATGTLSLTGTIKDGVAPSKINGTVHLSGKFWGEGVNKDQAIDTLSVTLRKQ